MQNTFFLVLSSQLSQISYVSFSSVSYSHHVVQHILVLIYNWKFVPFDNLTLIYPHNGPRLITTNLISEFSLLPCCCCFKSCIINEIYLTLSDLFHLVLSPKRPPILLQIAGFLHFLWLNNIPCVCACVCIYPPFLIISSIGHFHPMMDAFHLLLL